MHQTQLRHWGRVLHALAVVGLLVASGGMSNAECPPSQLAEADNAYGSVYDLIVAGNWATAIPSLESALKICAEHLPSLTSLARAYRELAQQEKVNGAEDAKAVAAGLLAKSRATYQVLLEVKGSSAEASDYGEFGRTLAMLEDYAGARDKYGKAYALSPQDGGIAFNLAFMHFAVADYRRSVDMFERALEIMPDQAEKIYPRLADAAKKAAEKEAKIGNTAEADAYRKKWQDYAAQAGGAQGGDLIAKLMKEKNWDGAIQAAEKVLTEDPNRKSARFNLARCYEAKGQYVEAATEYTKYIELDPDNEKAHAYLVIALSEAGRCAEAMSRAQQAVSRFTPKGLQALGGIYYGFGKALECGKDYASAREKFRLSAGSGDEVYSSYARRQMERMDQMIQRDAALKKQADQGGS